MTVRLAPERESGDRIADDSSASSRGSRLRRESMAQMSKLQQVRKLIVVAKNELSNLPGKV